MSDRAASTSNSPASPTASGKSILVLLAAGRGTRVGGPKALMTVGSQPWWRVQAERIAHTGLDSLWVVSPEVNAALHSAADSPRQRVLADSGKPMFASVLTALRRLASMSPPPSAAFILPIDTPAPTDPATYRSLGATGRVAVPTHNGQHGHPVCLPWSWITAALAGPIARTADPESLRLDELIRADTVYVPVTDPAVTTNLNTQDDVCAFEHSARSLA